MDASIYRKAGYALGVNSFSADLQSWGHAMPPMLSYPDPQSRRGASQSKFESKSVVWNVKKPEFR